MHPKIDHLVYCVHNLDAAIQRFEALLGIRPRFGGYHKTQGTKNAVLHLGDGCYLELLAVDEANLDITGSRWMGIDLLKEEQLTRWAIKSGDIENEVKALAGVNSDLGEVRGGSRQLPSGELLEWELSMPLAEPAVEVLPFLIDWKNPDLHPSAGLEKGCQLKQLIVSHPAPETISPCFRQLNIDISILPSAQATLEAIIECPNGLVRI